MATGGYVLPHDDVVLRALVHVSNALALHPSIIGEGIARRPTIMTWIAGGTTSMHFSAMRLLIMRLVNEHGVRFSENGFHYNGAYIHAHGEGRAIPVQTRIKANPSVL